MSDVLQVPLTRPQHRLVTTPSQFPAMVAGFGSGKTKALILRVLALKFRYPKQNVAYYLPTYDLVSTIAFPRLEEELEALGLEIGQDFKAVKSLKPRIEFPDGGMIIMRTMDKPSRIVGYEVADSVVDELDTLKQVDASAVWKKIIARNRQKKPDGAKNTVAVGTTPEGFRFVYETWKKKPPSDQYELIPASTHSNARNLPETYIQELTDAYPSNLIAAYIGGEFVNLTSGSVYPEFDRDLNGSRESVQPGEPLHIGLDFNVTKMAAVVFVSRDGDPHAVDEMTGMYDTPAAIGTIKGRYPGHPIYIYPDASGAARKSNNASVSDISLLQAAGFVVFVNQTNPLVKDRVLSMNVMIHAGGIRRLRINVDKCPMLTESLEKQAYDKNGEPDKTSGLDHSADAGGYHICYRYPVRKPNAARMSLKGT